MTALFGSLLAPWNPLEHNHKHAQALATATAKATATATATVNSLMLGPKPAELRAMAMAWILSHDSSSSSMEEEAVVVGEAQDAGPDPDPEPEPEPEQASFPFLDLPLEIRLQVYGWVHLMHPIRQSRLTPWYPVPVRDKHILKAVCARETGTKDCWACRRGGGGLPETRTGQGQGQGRPLAGMPTALLQSSGQVYAEARQVPLASNEFVFVNCFASGLWAARSFMLGLRPWQRDALRYARLDILAADPLSSPAGWEELCGLWAVGLRGLRLNIGRAGPGAGKRQPSVLQALDRHGRPSRWVEHGLSRLRGLRWLEIELLAADCDGRTRVEWCAGLAQAVNDGRRVGEGLVSVVCVEQTASL